MALTMLLSRQLELPLTRGPVAQITTFDFHDSAVFAVGDTLTFVIAGENHSAEVLSLDGDDILSLKFHGSSTTITEGSGTHVVTSTSAAGNITQV